MLHIKIAMFEMDGFEMDGFMYKRENTRLERYAKHHVLCCSIN